MPGRRIPFVDFYSLHGIIPTRQDISDFRQHVERRISLYGHLGLPPSAFRGASVLEIGPGSGHNAIVTGMLEPRRYFLVDGNPPSLESTNRLLRRYCPRVKFELRLSSILRFKAAEKFDIVLCEAVIPTQHNPAAFLRHVARFVRPGGVLVFTCMDTISLLAEMLRRWLAWDLVKNIPTFDAKVARLVDFFQPDLAALPGMSRRPDDWVIDQMLHPWAGPLFSIPQAIDALGRSGMILGSSPRFLRDWRWYKNMVGPQCTDNSFAVDSYYEFGLNLIDFRVTLPQTDRRIMQRVGKISQRIYKRIFGQETGDAPFPRTHLIPLVTRLARLLREHSPETGRSAESFSKYLRSDMRNVGSLAAFRKWWGRGQQYISYLMR